MVVLKSTMEARIADLKEAHEANRKDLMKLVDAMAEQVEYLRLQMGRPNTQRMVPLNPAQQPPHIGGSAHLSEEEEDLQALFDGGHIDMAELQALKEQLDLPNLAIAP